MNTENNKLIAEFMGLRNIQTYNTWIIPLNMNCDSMRIWVNDLKGGYHFKDDLLRFNSSWDWLMPVVEKIENLRTIEDDGYYDFTIFSDAVFITKEANRDDIIIINKSDAVGSINHEPILFEDKITSVYWACVIFIKWYNKETKNCS